MSKTVFIVGGSNGAGKTTFAKEFIKEEQNLIFLNADEIEKEFNPNDTQGGKTRAGREFFKRLNLLINSKDSFVIESTLSGKYLTKIIKKLRDKKFQIVLLYVFLDNSELAIDRVKTRVEEGGHNVPNADVIRRFYRSKNNFWNLYRFLVDSWQLFYNGEDNIIQVGLGAKEDLFLVNNEKFKLFMEGVKK